MITEEIRHAARYSRLLKFYLDGNKPSEPGSRVFPIEGRDVQPLILLWVQANPAMRSLGSVRQSRHVAAEEHVLVECLL